MSCSVGKLLLASMVVVWPGMSSAQTYTRTETTTYIDDSARWVLGQVAQTTINGVVDSQTTYNANTQPNVIKSFGRTVQTLTYNTDGTVATVTDGNNNVTRLSNWKGGIPQLIQYADGTSESAVVSNQGWITSVTDENGYVTSYGYDTMGRLNEITYPTGDSTSWSITTQTFAQIASTEVGIPAGHWRQTVGTGNARKITYYDALLRPLVMQEYDTAAQAATQSFRRMSYDAEGRVVFASYPSTVNNPTTGTWTEYDVLGRVTSVSQDSEQGLLSTVTEYLPGFTTRRTDPRGFVTNTSYRTYDKPTLDLPISVSQPEGAVTEITRDPFDQPTEITRRNADASVQVTRKYAYGTDRQLCLTIEPETGATLFRYDAASNLVASVSGATVPTGSLTWPDSGTTCTSALAAVTGLTSRTYDARNRLKTLSFPDGLGNQTWSYTADGLPSQIVTNNSNGGDAAINAYVYNRRRLLTGESATYAGATLSLGYGYAADGSLANHSYPSGLQVDYAPNALGQPTKAGTYATGVTYYPNGAIKQFTYGNGIVHTMTQNARQLPARSTDAGLGSPLDMAYGYDKNANVSAITDYKGTGRQTRSMTYDGLNRLLTTQSVMFGGDNLARFSYDVLDNLKTFNVGSSRDYVYAYNAKQQLETVNNAAGGAAVMGLGYDVRGNLANRNGVLYRFDYGNRLREATGLETYRYDGQGRRVKATAQAGGDIDSFYDMGGVLRFQRDMRRGNINEYVQLGGSLVAKVTNPAVAAPAAAPTLTAPASSATGSYTVSWTTVTGATRYELEEQINGGGWTQIQRTNATNSPITGKANGTYGYRVRACNAGGCGGYSAVLSTIVVPLPSAAPVVTVPSANSTGGFTVTWTAVSTATSYRLEEQVNSGQWALVYQGGLTSWSTSGRGNGTYAYRVQACNVSGCGGYSSVASSTVLLPPGVPTVSLPASSNNGSFTVSWSGVATATSYRLEEQVNGGAWTLVYNGSATSLATSGRGNGTYAYRAQACNGGGCSGYSSVPATTVLLPPGAPGVTAPSSNSNGSFTISWTTVATASSYRLEEQVNGGSWTQVYNAAGTSWATSGRGNGTYGYRAQACNSGGCSGYSGVASTTVLLPPAGAPALSVPGGSTSGSYTVSWTAIATATRYELEERLNGGGWSQIQATSATSAAIGGKASGNYGYRVRACNSAGCGSYAGESTVAVTLLVPPVLTSYSAVAAGDPIDFTWNLVPGATRYVLEEITLSPNVLYDGPGTSATRKTVPGVGGRVLSFRIKACDTSGYCSAYSPTQTVGLVGSGGGGGGGGPQ